MAGHKGKCLRGAVSEPLMATGLRWRRLKKLTKPPFGRKAAMETLGIETLGQRIIHG